MHLTIDHEDCIIVHCRKDGGWAVTQCKAQDELFERMEDAPARAMEVYRRRTCEWVKVLILPRRERL